MTVELDSDAGESGPPRAMAGGSAGSVPSVAEGWSGGGEGGSSFPPKLFVCAWFIRWGEILGS